MNNRKTSLQRVINLLLIMYCVSLIATISYPSTIFGASASASAKVSPSPVATSSASLAQKINEIKEKAASKAADFLSQVTKKLQNKAYFGVVESIDGTKVTLVFQNKDYEANTDEYTTFASSLKSTKKVTALKDFAKGDFVSALGDADDKGVLKAKKLIKSSPIASDSATLVWGVVQKVSGGAITVKLADSTDQIITSSGRNPIFLGSQEGSLADIKMGRTIIARGKQTANAGLTSTYIYIIPPTADAKPEKNESTKSAVTTSASPSASPKKR